MRSVIGPKSVIERSTRSTMTDGEMSGSSSPRRARRSYSSTARNASTRTSSRSPSGRSWRRSIRANTSRRIPSYASTVTAPPPSDARSTRDEPRLVRRTRRSARPERAARGTARCASAATPVVNGPRGTSCPVHAARSTRRSVGTNVRLAGVNVREISWVSSARWYRSVGARFNTRCTRASAGGSAATHPSRRATPTGLAAPTPTSTPASAITARAISIPGTPETSTSTCDRIRPRAPRTSSTSRDRICAAAARLGSPHNTSKAG